jgi:hypothetical protein
MALRFRDELKCILKAMGPDVPDPDARVTRLARGDRCYFGIDGGVYTWADGIAWRVHEANGSERYEGWRDGKRIGDIHPPGGAHWN